MSFKIVKSPKAWWPVTFSGVSEDGAIVQNSFEMRFRILDEDEQAAIEAEFRDLGEQEGADALIPSKVSADLVMRIAEDWRGVCVDDGTEAGASLPFSAENVPTLMKVPNVFRAIGDAYRACRAGVPEARRGN